MPGTVPPQPDTAEAAEPGPKVVERAHPLTPLVKGWLILVAFGWYYLQEFARSGRGEGPRDLPVLVVVGGVAAVAVLAALFGVISWRTTKFIADDSELRVETGWLFRQSRRLAYTRIQSVDVVQPLAARILGLAELRIDAGGDSTKLQYLGRQRAYQMRDYLMRRAHGQSMTVAASNAAVSSGVLEDLGAADEVLVRVAPQHLILGALMSHDLLALLITFALPAVAVTVASWIWPDSWVTEARSYVQVGTLLPMAFAVFSFLSTRVVAQFSYTLARTPAGLRISRGLTHLTSQTVPVDRIQSIRMVQPLLWRLLRRWRLDVEVLGYGPATNDESSKEVSTILLPIGDAQQVAVALGAVWPGLRLDDITFTPSPARARWLDPLAYTWNGFGSDRSVVVTRRGWATRTQSIVPHARLQSVSARQGPLERRLRLADVSFHTTGTINNHGAIHLDADVVRQLVYGEMDLATTSRAEELTHRPRVDRAGDAGGMTPPQGPSPVGPILPDRAPTGPLSPDRLPAGPLPGLPVPGRPDLPPVGQPRRDVR